MRRWLWRAALALAALAVACVVLAYRPDVSVAELKDDYAGGTSRFASIDGTHVHYRDEGRGPALLLLHGTGSSLHTWDGWLDHLGHRFRVLRLDLQGHGLTGPNPEHDYSIERQMAVIDELLDRLGVGSCAVAGNSLGGLIAWRYALSRPGRVDRLVLIDSAGAPAPAGFGPDAGAGGLRTLDLARVPVVKHLLTRLTPRWLVVRSMEQVYGDPSRVTPELVDRYHRLLLRAGNRRALVHAMGQRRRPRAEDPRRRLGELRQPTLVMWGREDRWIPVEHASRFHDVLPASRLVIYDGVGHLPMEEVPGPSARDAAAFLLAADPIAGVGAAGTTVEPGG